MVQDKYSAVWVSNSSMNDYLQCPRLYYLRNVYKNQHGKKINLISPSLSLGQSVHEVLEALAILPCTERMNQPLLEIFETVWQKFSGRKGGFASVQEEQEYKNRGQEMIKQVMKTPGPLLSKAIRLPVGKNNMPPNFLLSVTDNIILCGKIDWLEYIPETDSVHIIDFKTGKHEEKADSMQLPIYCLLVKKLQKRTIHKVSYWYLSQSDGLKEKELPDCDEAEKIILQTARKIKQTRETRTYDCLRKGCFACQPFEAIVRGEAEYVGTSGYQDIYIQ